MIRKLTLILLYLSLPVIAALGTILGLRHVMLSPYIPDEKGTVYFEVPENASFGAVAKQLHELGIVRFDWAFKLLAKLKRKDTSIMAGEYELSAAMAPEDILEKMVSGKMILRRFTVKEGASIWEIGSLVAKAGITSRSEFDAALTNPNLLNELGVSAASFEGYLFPETYQFPKGTKPKKIVTAMMDQLRSNWDVEWDAKIKESGLTKHQVLTLASIVEKESGDREEQPLIAAVFLNRLKKKMRLQADPTVIYGMTNYNGNITKDDLLTPTPYNTYIIDALPPGPIANPGESAIRAVLYPAQSDALYFVADGKGRHIFSNNLEDHNQAVRVYQKGGG